MQLDLVDYIADGAGDDDTQSRVSRPSTARCVQFEHKPVGSGTAPCVQIEHIHAAPPAMSSHRLLLCLIVLGWSERDLARRVCRHQTTIRRWTDGSSIVDREVARWLEDLVAFHTAHPAPRHGEGVGSRSGGLSPAL